MDCELQTRHQVLQRLRHRLFQVQQCMKQFSEVHHQEVTFNVGDLVLLNYNLITKFLLAIKDSKVAPLLWNSLRYFTAVGSSWQLVLPSIFKLHPLSHVSSLDLRASPLLSLLRINVFLFLLPRFSWTLVATRGSISYLSCRRNFLQQMLLGSLRIKWLFDI